MQEDHRAVMIGPAGGFRQEPFISGRKKMGKINRMRCTVGVLLFAFLCAALPVRAEELQTPEWTYPRWISSEEMSQGTYSSTEEKTIAQKAEIYRELEERITETLLEEKYAVDLSGIDMDYMMFLQYYDMCPYFGQGIRAYDFTEGEEMNIINPLSKEETQELVKTVNSKITQIYSLTANSASDVEKALAVHDYLVYRCEYDYDNYINGTLPDESGRCGGMMVNGRGVCNAYARAYEYFMTKAGIECHTTSSSAMNHAWNIVNVGGSYYHVDCTWDDPVPDRFGQVSHGHFLVSDRKIQEELEHYGWNRTDLVCDSEQYESAYWTETDTQIIQAGGKSYYLKGASLCCRENGEERELADLGIWPVWQGSGWWTSAFSGLFYHNGYLYCNTYDAIIRVPAGGGNPEIVYSPDLSQGYVYGIRDQGVELQYVIKQSYRDTGTVYTAPVSLEVPAVSVSLDQTEIAMQSGERIWLHASVKPDNATVELQWSSDHPETASVDENGFVTAIVPGQAVITVTANDVTASCIIQVEAPKYVRGDANGDGEAGIDDLRLVLRHVCRKTVLEGTYFQAADVTDDGDVDIQDLRKILRFVCKKIPEL